VIVRLFDGLVTQSYLAGIMSHFADSRAAASFVVLEFMEYYQWESPLWCHLRGLANRNDVFSSLRGGTELDF
jgi:hypothetical protein